MIKPMLQKSAPELKVSENYDTIRMELKQMQTEVEQNSLLPNPSALIELAISLIDTIQEQSRTIEELQSCASELVETLNELKRLYPSLQL